MSNSQPYSLAQIAEHIGGEVTGDGAVQIQSLATLASATAGDLSFLSNSKYASELSNTNAGGVILSAKDAENYTGNAIVHANPYVGFALAAQLLDSTPSANDGIHPSATIADSAKIGADAKVGPGAVIEENAVVGDGVTIGANTVVGKGATLGNGVNLRANVTIYHGVLLGNNVSVHSGTVIGSDGFGYANDKGQWVKIPQTGSVVVGDDTEIGSNTSIDRGALDNTIIGKNCIIDNHVQIAHNCIIGDHSCICGSTGLAGSVTLGKYVVLAGHVGVAGHLSIADGVQVTGYTMVSKSITEPGVYSSGMPSMPTREWHKVAAQVRNIGKLNSRVKQLEKGE